MNEEMIDKDFYERALELVRSAPPELLPKIVSVIEALIPTDDGPGDDWTAMTPRDSAARLP